MMLVLPFQKVRPAHASLVGGKALSLAMLSQTGLAVPEGVAITTRAYQDYLKASGLRNQIRRELSWRPIEEMRWEEMWDASLRIRNAFLTTPMPARLRRALSRSLSGRFRDTPVVVRSSAPGEDASNQSFAGLHESYLNVCGLDAILEHIRLVWASLWSDGALLYRKELGLNIKESAMAVVVQRFVPGSRSGVAFGRHPMRPECAAVEAVHGLNQGLVDGSVPPDRWTLDGQTGAILEFQPAERTRYVAHTPAGVTIKPLPKVKARRRPLSERDLKRVFEQTLILGEQFNAPQDVEWTFRGARLFLLQSRDITTAKTAAGDKRTWYLSLRRSFDNLEALRDRIENDLIPKMDAEARRLGKRSLRLLADAELLKELASRHERYQMWLDRYWEECIPFAHGVRLFGQVYNDVVQPEDPYEFVQLLAGGELASVERNNALLRLAEQVRSDKRLRAALQKKDVETGHRAFWKQADEFQAEFASIPQHEEERMVARRAMAPLLLQMAGHAVPDASGTGPHKEELEEAFLAKYGSHTRSEGKALLELGRASYRLRDDDNVYLGRIARQVDRAREEAERRNLKLPEKFKRRLGIRPTGGQQHAVRKRKPRRADFTVHARQLPGQPAGPGFASGPARVIENPEDLYAFRSGEVLVCDAVDPNMTFVMPLAAGIVECRGGMLVHGAIIAREYGIPCITGVTKALKLVATGDTVQVDGYLGVVTLG